MSVSVSISEPVALLLLVDADGFALYGTTLGVDVGVGVDIKAGGSSRRCRWLGVDAGIDRLCLCLVSMLMALRFEVDGDIKAGGSSSRRCRWLGPMPVSMLLIRFLFLVVFAMAAACACLILHLIWG